MNLLYPRLLRHRAKLLAADYKMLSAIELHDRWTLSDESAVFVATGGTRVTTERIQTLREIIVDLAKSAGFPEPANAAARTEFDLALAKMLHREMRIAPAEAASGDVWAFFALIVLPDVAHWRFPAPPVDRVLATDLTRHVFGRMWWRAQFVYAPADADPYRALHILGEAAFDQIYARRVALGGSPHLIKGILRVWATVELAGLAEREVLRDFLKRLLRLAPFLVFEALDETALDEELNEVVAAAVEGVRNSKMIV